jgi:glycosyltransferase involved in cell wall biosynthesis
MTSYINSRFLTQPITGVQRFAIEISLQLKRILGNKIQFISPLDVLHEDVSKQLEVKIIGRKKGYLWEQFDLPEFLIKKGSPLLINLCSTAPMFYSNQIITHHDITYVRYPETFSTSFKFAYKLIVPLMLKHSKALITVSDFSKKEIASYYKYPVEKIHVVPNAVNNKFAATNGIDSLTSEKYAPYFLTVSSNNYHKNFERLIQSFSLLPKDINVNLLIVGSHSNKSFKSLSFSSKMKMDKRIYFLGRVDDDCLIKLYQHAEAFLFPSLYEGFGIPPLEAQACGCPVLSSNAASMPEVLKSSVLYFDPLNITTINERMLEIIGNEKLREDLKEKGLSNIRRFSWEESANKIIQVLRTI